MLNPLNPTVTESSLTYSAVTLTINRDKRTADLTVQAPTGPQPSTPDEILKAGDQFWPLRAFRELDDALLRLRVNEPEIGTIIIRTEGDRAAVLAIDETLLAHQSHWLVREIVHFMKRTLKRVDLDRRARSSRSSRPDPRSPARCSSWRSRPIAPTCSTTTTKRTSSPCRR